MIKSLLVINLKALFAGMFRAGAGSKKRSKAKIVLFTLLFVYCIGAFIMMFGMMFLQICEPLYEAGIGWLYFSMLAITIFALCLFTGIFAVHTQIFNAKDNELLLAMPVKPSSIVMSRILSLLVYEYLFDILIAVPAVIVWWVSGYSTVAGTVILVVGILLAPLLALAFACVVGWVIAAISSRMRNKNIIVLVFSLAFLAAYFAVFTNMQNYIGQLIINGEQIADAIRRAVFPAYYFGVAAAQESIVDLLIFAACAVLPFALMCAILTRSFISIATRRRGAKKIEYRERRLRASGARIALLGIELRRFFSNAMIILNAGIGAIFILALAAVLLVKPSLVTSVTDQFLIFMPGVSSALLCGAVIMMLCSMVTMSSASVSLEGKTLWLAKSLPVAGGDVLLAKAAAHMLVSGVPSLLASVACIVRLGADPLSALAVLIAPAAISITMGFFGVMVNLAFPKLDWINEIQPVKQSASVIICMLGAMAFVLAIVLVYIFLLTSIMSVTAYMLACSAFLLLLSALMYVYLMRGGSRRFAALY